MNNLYIVSTPIGNLQDITLRAAEILLTSKIIVAESSSKAGLLLNFLEKQFGKVRADGQKIISLTEDEEENKIAYLLPLMEQNSVTLISEAGTPLVSDPGFRFVREAIKKGINVISIPGATAPIAALTSSGFPTDKFIFLGFLPKSVGKQKEVLGNLKDYRAKQNVTAVLFESPHRLIDTLNVVCEVFGNINIAVARELTKVHEEIRREKISETIQHFSKTTPKGEFVILF